MESRCETPPGKVLTTVPLNCHLLQHHGRTLQYIATDDHRSINCDMTGISRVTQSCCMMRFTTLFRKAVSVITGQADTTVLDQVISIILCVAGFTSTL